LEVYLDVAAHDGAPATAEALIDAMSRSSGVPRAEVDEAVTILEGTAAAQHLFAVASGLDSIVVGENEIVGQVRDALKSARKAHSTSSLLDTLFQRAIVTSRAVKARTSIGGTRRSLVELALDVARDHGTDPAVSCALVIGTGHYADITVAALRELGTTDIEVFSPTDRAAAFAARHGVVASTDLIASLEHAQLVVSCTTGTVVLPAHFTSGSRPLVIDLGLPRNVDPEVGDIDGIVLLDLESIRANAPVEHRDATREARELIATAAADFTRHTSIEPAVVGFRHHIRDLLETEIDRANSRGGDAATEEALRHFASVLLHGPSVRARELADQGRDDEYVAGLAAIFGITDSSRR
jgi:glutamyl-tRNA reductase